MLTCKYNTLKNDPSDLVLHLKSGDLQETEYLWRTVKIVPAEAEISSILVTSMCEAQKTLNPSYHNATGSFVRPSLPSMHTDFKTHAPSL